MSRRRSRFPGIPEIGPDPTGAGVTRARGFECRECGVWFGVFQNVTDISAGPNAINGNPSFSVECPSCKHSDEYSITELRPFTQSAPPIEKA